MSAEAHCRSIEHRAVEVPCADEDAQNEIERAHMEKYYHAGEVLDDFGG